MVDFQRWYYLILPTLIILHAVVSPYTKVEESFNIQAIHDILKYGIPTSNAYFKFKGYFDHIEFPGSVPRTFLGSLVVAFCTRPVTWLGHFEGFSQQTIARGMLGLLNAAAFVAYMKAIRKAYGDRTASWYTLLQSSQFHVIYYSSRTLPNTFAFCLSTFAHAALLPDSTSSLGRLKRARLALYIFALTTVIFRAELALLLGSHALYLLLKTDGFTNQVSVLRHTIFPSVLAGAIAGLILTVSIDTYFWQSSSLLWPEGAAFLFNVLPSKDHQGASAWGTSPWYWYFTSAVPRLVLNPSLILLPWAILFTPQRPAILGNTIPTLIYTILYSFLPHKETRFLFPVVPPLTLAVALALSYLNNRRQKIAKFGTVFLFATTLTVAFVSHAIILPLSAQSYPGGHALQILHAYHDSVTQNITNDHQYRPQIRVHLTNLALQTGVTRFLHRDQSYISSSLPNPNLIKDAADPSVTSPLVLPGSPDGQKPALTIHPRPPDDVHTKRTTSNTQRPYQWIYDKTSPSSEEFLNPQFWDQFDYVVVEDPARVIGAWRIVGESKSLSRQRPRLLRPHEGRSGTIITTSPGKDNHIEAEGKELPKTQNRDGLFELLEAMYGGKVAWVYGVLHDVLREGSYVGRSLTRGYWIEWGLETRLYILESSESGTEP